MIQADSTLVALRRARLLLLVVVPLLAIFLLWNLYTTLLQLSLLPSLVPSILSTIVNLLLELALCVGVLVNVLLQCRYWQHIEQRRMAAARRDRRLLTAEPPVPGTSLLRPPLGIRMPQYISALALWPALLLLLGLVLSPLLSLIGSLALFHHLTPAGWLLYLFEELLLLMFIAILAAVLWRLVHQELDVTEDGLTSRSLGQTHSVPWHEARLFARYEAFGTQRSGAAIIYELSSATDIVRWTCMRHRTAFLGQVSNVTLDEHTRREAALHSFVAAKTGLPLYDLDGNHS